MTIMDVEDYKKIKLNGIDDSFMINETTGETPDFEWYGDELDKIRNMNIKDIEKNKKIKKIHKEFYKRYKK